MTDEETIRRTLALYCHYLDDGRFDDYGRLFADDATLILMGGTHQGPDAIRAFMEKVQPAEHRGKHLCGNSVIDVDGDHAKVLTDFTFVSRKMVVTAAGRYHDRLVKQGDRWLFAERRIDLMSDAQREPG